ncbi:hypothetical protein ABT160_02480 [Streptomyces sp. NPDC001941]|uniref:hypothetical protein n=1 Tax=Streptomyces sp. NPDC001941 TaxID=3154659 RepID=UPI00332BAA15
MSALTDLLDALEVSPEVRPGKARALWDAALAEHLEQQVLAEELRRIEAGLAERWPVVAAFLAEDRARRPVLHPGEPPVLDMSSGRMRRDYLAAAIETHGGDWTTARVLRLYREAAFTVTRRHTVRADLGYLHRAGLLELHDNGTRRHYTRRAAS